MALDRKVEGIGVVQEEAVVMVGWLRGDASLQKRRRRALVETTLAGISCCRAIGAGRSALCPRSVAYRPVELPLLTPLTYSTLVP